jgi:hypothetical protein
MKSAALVLIGAAWILASAVTPAQAQDSFFATEEQAHAACGADEVVWIDLDKGRFYHKSQEKFAKGGNGGFACLRTAHARYREAHE